MKSEGFHTLAGSEYPDKPGVSNSLKLSDKSSDFPEGFKDDNFERMYYNNCFKPFESRLSKLIDEDRLFHDEIGVAVMAMKIGLSKIENSEGDAIAVRNQAWLQNEDYSRLKESLLDSLSSELESYQLDNLRDLDPEELLQFYRNLMGRPK